MASEVEDGQIARFLLTHAGRDYCDVCLAAIFDLTSDEVAYVAVGLGRRPAFLRDRWRCGKCGTDTVVTRAFPLGFGFPGSERRAS